MAFRIVLPVAADNPPPLYFGRVPYRGGVRLIRYRRLRRRYLRSKFDGVDNEEMEIRVGIHGVLVCAGHIDNRSTGRGTCIGYQPISGAVGRRMPAASVTGENIIAYEYKLFGAIESGAI